MRKKSNKNVEIKRVKMNDTIDCPIVSEIIRRCGSFTQLAHYIGTTENNVRFWADWNRIPLEYKLVFTLVFPDLVTLQDVCESSGIDTIVKRFRGLKKAVDQLDI